ncbi:hypothetical protein PGT21_000582, partial [Puccinia graminis f. sp. tritici]
MFSQSTPFREQKNATGLRVPVSTPRLPASDTPINAKNLPTPSPARNSTFRGSAGLFTTEPSAVPLVGLYSNREPVAPPKPLDVFNVLANRSLLKAKTDIPGPTADASTSIRYFPHRQVPSRYGLSLAVVHISLNLESSRLVHRRCLHLVATRQADASYCLSSDPSRGEFFVPLSPQHQTFASVFTDPFDHLRLLFTILAVGPLSSSTCL